jgi:hypothetical protein
MSCLGITTAYVHFRLSRFYRYHQKVQVAEGVTNMYKTISGPTTFTSGFLGVTCIYRFRVYTAPLRPTVLVRPLKFPIHPGSGSTVCYRFLKVLVIGGEKGFLFYPLIGQVSGDYKQIFPQVTTGS